MNRYPSAILCFLLSIISLLGGCASLRPRGGYSWEKSAAHAAFAPETIIPLVAAGVIAINGSDAKISDWASTNTPVFGSRENAERWSDILDNSNRTAGLVTALLVPENKTAFVTVDLAAQGITGAATYAMKNTARRERPDRSDDQSFPSGHSSDAAANAIVAARNVEYLHISPFAKATVQAGVITSAAGTAWARVEANKHCATDVLVGAALGSVLTNLIYDMYIPENVRIGFVPHGDATLMIAYVYF